jgi:hypothetical protein
MSKKLIADVAPELTSLLNSKDKELWAGHRRLSGYDIVSYQASLKKLTIDPGLFVHNGISLEDTSQQTLDISPSLFVGDSLQGTVTDPVVLFASTSDNIEASGHTFGFDVLSSVDITLVALIARYDGTSWEPVEAVSVHGVLELALQLKAFVGDVSPLQSVLATGAGAGFREVEVDALASPSNATFRPLVYVVAGTTQEIDFLKVDFNDGNSLDDDIDGAPSVPAFTSGLKSGSWYYGYGKDDGAIGWSLVPPMLGTRPAWIWGTSGFAVTDNIQILSASNSNIKVNLNGTSHTGSVPEGTYTIRQIEKELMKDSNWVSGRSPIRVFDFGNPAASSRAIGIFGAEGSGVSQEMKLETISNDIYSLLGI